MAVDLYCYALARADEVEIALASLSANNSAIFSEKFLISKVRDASPIHKEISLEYGAVATSFFMISLNEKSAANLVLDAVEL